LKFFSGTTATNVILAVLTAISSIVIARLFGPELRGQFATATALLNTSVSVAILGAPAFLAKHVANLELGQTSENIDVFRAAISMTGLGSLIAILLITLLTLGGEVLPIEPLSQLAIIIFIVCGVLSVLLLNISLGQANWMSFNVSRLLFAGGTVAAVFVYSLLGGASLFGLIVCLAIANLLSVSIQLFMLQPITRTTVGWWKNGWTVIVGSRYYALNSIGNVSTGYADILVFSYIFAPSQVGFWAVARSVAALLSPINNALSVKVFSVFARQEQKAVSGFSQLVRNFLVFNFISAIILYLIAEPLIKIIFGLEFVSSIALVPFALLAVIASSFSELMEERLRGCGRPGPVNISRFVPPVVLLCVYAIAQQVTEVSQFALYFALAQCLRGFVVVQILRALSRKSGGV